MGITIVQKRDLSVRKKNAKVALVLAGGAITGGAFKLGGLKALDDFLVNRKTTEFDAYVGLSAGALLAAPLSAGVSPAEMLKSLEGKSTEFSRFRLATFYNLNMRDLMRQPARFAFDLLTFLPGTVGDLLAQMPEIARKIEKPLYNAVRKPRLTAVQDILEPVGEALAKRRDFPPSSTTCRQVSSTTAPSSSICGVTSKRRACPTSSATSTVSPSASCTSAP